VAKPVPQTLPTEAQAAATSVTRAAIEARSISARTMIDGFERELATNPVPQRAGRLHYECARLYESPLGDLVKASEQYQKAHALLSHHLPSVQGARRTLVAQKNFIGSLPLFDAEIRMTSDPRRKALVYFEKGAVLEEMGQKPQAREAYEAGLELDKTDATLLKVVERVSLGAKAWDGLDRTYERAANVFESDPRHRAAVIAERARLAEVRKNDHNSAAELYGLALGTFATSPSPIQALKRLHFNHQRWNDLVNVLEKEAELASDPAARAMALFRVGRIQLDRLGQLEAATSAFERATRETPNDRVILEELARAYEQAKRYSDLASTLEHIAQMVPTSLEKVGYYHRIGQIHEERTNEETRAIEWYERALAAEKSYLPAIQALAKLYVRAQRWESLIAVHSGEAEGSLDVERRAAAHARIADVYETKLGRPELATQHHSRALGLVPGYEASFKSLSRLLTQAGRFTELVELYERAVDGAHDAETKITYLFKIGRLHEDSLGDFSSAVTAYRRILDVEAHHLGAIHAVQRAAERAGRHKELMSALELEAGHVADKKRRLEILHRAGEVAEMHLADDQLALATYKKVSELDKNYTPVLASLGRLYYRLGRWEDLLETYRSELRLAPKGSTAAALHYKMGELYEERIGKDDEAIAAFRRAVEADPFHSPSLSALTRKLGERGRWEELVKLLELELSGSKDAEVRARTAFRVGEIYENRLRQPEKALGAYEQALAADSDFRPARDGRIRLLSDARDHKRLVEELEKEANAARDPIMAVTALFRAGEVYRDEMNDPVRAIQAFEKVIEREPAHLEAMLALEPLYAERGAWEELSKTYSAEARVLADPRARVAALRELARLMERRGSGTAEQIQETYFAIMQLAPDDLGALLALERLALREQDGRLMAHVDVKLGSVFEDASLVSAHLTRLAELLEAGGDPGALDVYRVALTRDATNLAAARGLSRLAERRGDPALLEEAASHEASVTLDRPQAARLLVRAGEIRADHAESEAATRLFERALELYPDHEPAAARLRDLRLSRGEVERLIGALTHAAGAAQRERSLQLWMIVAELYADRKGDLPAALAALGRANNLAPNHVGTLLRLGDYFARDSQWQQAAERWRQATLQAASDDVKIEAHLRLAAVLDEHLDDPTRSLASVEAVLAVDANHRGALDRLLSLLLRKGDHDKAAETAARLIKVSPGVAERVDAQTKLGRLERKRGRTGAAAQAYEEAVALSGLEGDAARELLELVREKPRKSDSPSYASYAGALSRFVEQARGNDPKLVPVFTELSRVYGDELKQPEQAVVALERGLAIYPDPALFEELGLRLSSAGQYQRAIPALYRALETDVRRERAFRKLAEAYEALARPVEAQLALVPLGALGLANDFERASLSARRPRPALGGPRSFDTAMLDSLSIVPVPDAATNLLAVLADGLGKVYQPDLERYGLSARDRISAKSGHPLRQLCDRVAQIFGVSDYDLYTHQYPSPGVEVELGDPIAVLVPPMFGTLSEPQQVFLLSRVFANIARRLSVVDRLDAQELDLLLAAGARIVVPNFGQAKDDEYLNQLARKVARTLPWIGRGAIEDAAREYAAQDKFDAAEWIERQRLAATRAALVVGDDLSGAVALIQQHPTALGIEPGRLVPELVRFWASEPALTLRKRLGML
jgi:tetratricopeptide (TPR) repeat protein